MSDEGYRLPDTVITVSFYSSLISSLIIAASVILHLRNYRKPFQQRLMIRIHLIVPLFALLCYSMLSNQNSYFNKIVLEPIRESYEAFVIYTFFSLLTDMLGGERHIIIMTSGREPVAHPGFLGKCLPRLDISDPYTFLWIKRGILQYVWLKPFICFSMIFGELFHLYDINDMGIKSPYLWLTILYNLSVTISLYCLALFWKILWNDLKPFNPVGKFLCVKLIIFASYWQGVLLGTLSFFGILKKSGVPQDSNPGSDSQPAKQENYDLGLAIQNALLCVELIAFAVGHWSSFSYKYFTVKYLPSSRVQFFYALKDMFGIQDLVHDFKVTYQGDNYDYRKFDSVEALLAHPDSSARMSRIKQGLRYYNDGKHKHWLPLNMMTLSEPSQNGNGINSTTEENYAPSINSSTKGLISSSRGSIKSPPGSPRPGPGPGPRQHCTNTTPPLGSITAALNDENFSYDEEDLDEDEAYYQQATSVVNNYTLDQVEIQRLLNYPIVDDLINSHEYGYRVRKLRHERETPNRRLLNEQERRRYSNESSRYGSIV